ncbi:uncharacterized protein RJT20DRAFT_114696 [Scheffersomyces xylosifermentans]|uniref:uncharacterized protein n=1 Tax=Scheffersomyces xylosifermentans TaxID=1304137 RepID=UPI00315D2EC8
MVPSIVDMSETVLTEPERHESFIPQEPVNSIPTKRIFDFKSQRLKESLKMSPELELDESKQLLLKVKMVGINYKTDFNSFKQNSPKRNAFSDRFSTVSSVSSESQTRAIVPGNKIIGKIHHISEGYGWKDFRDSEHSKYLVYPYSNCIIQNHKPLCSSCQFLVSRNISMDLTPETYSAHQRHQCTQNLVYGYSINGGLQDYMKIVNPDKTLLKIPDNVSSHDSCFLLETMLPFYSFVKSKFSVPSSNSQSTSINIPGKILVVLNDISKEVNDVLIVLKHFQVDQSTVSFLDPMKISKLSQKELEKYRQQFNQIFLFDYSDDMIKFANYCSSSPGLESTKNRYNIVLFDQNDPESLLKNKHLSRYYNDKSYTQFKLSYKDKLHAQELLTILSSLNSVVKTTSRRSLDATAVSTTPVRRSRPSIASIDSAESTFSFSNTLRSTSTASTSPSSPETPAQSIINEPSKEYNSAESHYSWLWYDSDIELCSSCEQSDDEMADELYNDDTRWHSIKQMNRLIRRRELSRVGYTNRPHKLTTLNAFVFY